MATLPLTPSPGAEQAPDPAQPSPTALGIFKTHFWTGLAQVGVGSETGMEGNKTNGKPFDGVSRRRNRVSDETRRSFISARTI